MIPFTRSRTNGAVVLPPRECLDPSVCEHSNLDPQRADLYTNPTRAGRPVEVALAKLLSAVRVIRAARRDTRAKLEDVHRNLCEAHEAVQHCLSELREQLAKEQGGTDDDAGGLA
mgnify:CR=1 FL=1